ncbi:uncharacterized protein LOC131843886 [Achroia grisella]|uniref:uncharacterized protein LOC131843886 n=1 Tax=Achroia grisella TaxID=688607 RepID=UPI0027D27906|nr:uncharacterized protein LOC131843886 [Achroia grisella]
MLRSPSKQYHSNPDLVAAKITETPFRKRKRPENDLSFTLEKLGNTLSNKMDSMIAELRTEFVNNITLLNENINTNIKNELINLSTAVLQIKSEVNELRTEYTSMQTNISNLNSKYNVLSDELSALKDSLEFQYKEYSDMKVCIENSKLSSMADYADKLCNLQNKIDIMEQQSRQNNLEICFVPEKRGENLIILFESITTVIKYPIERKDILAIHRVPHARSDENNRPKNIIVKVSSRYLRDNILSAFRLSKGLKTDDLNIVGNSRKIYINEHLTLQNKKLFRDCREAAKLHGYKFVWIKNATILVRKSETSPIFAIRSQSEIGKFNKLKGQTTSSN